MYLKIETYLKLTKERRTDRERKRNIWGLSIAMKLKNYQIRNNTGKSDTTFI